MYGLKQAPRAWYAKMDAFLLSHKFKMCKSNCNVYMQKKGGCLFLIFIYVDDLIITSGLATRLRDIKSALSKAFSMTDLGLPR